MAKDAESKQVLAMRLPNKLEFWPECFFEGEKAWRGLFLACSGCMACLACSVGLSLRELPEFAKAA